MLGHPPPYALRQTVAPTEEPLTLAEAKAWLRVDAADDDAKIARLVTAARLAAERITGRRFCAATYRMTLDRFPSPVIPDLAYASVLWSWTPIRLPGGPVNAITSITYYDGAEVLQTLDSSYYQLAADFDPALLTVRFPPVTYPRPDAVKILYTAGALASAVSAAIKTAMLMTVNYWYGPAGAGDAPDARFEPAEGVPPAALNLLRAEWNGELGGGR